MDSPTLPVFSAIIFDPQEGQILRYHNDRWSNGDNEGAAISVIEPADGDILAYNDDTSLFECFDKKATPNGKVIASLVAGQGVTITTSNLVDNEPPTKKRRIQLGDAVEATISVDVAPAFDNDTIKGDGDETPYYVDPSALDFEVAMKHDEIYFSGDGKLGNPLTLQLSQLANKVPITHDEIYFSGDGTNENVLTLLPENLSEKVSIARSAHFLGNGTTESPLTLDETSIQKKIGIEVDNEQFTGDGTIGNALHFDATVLDQKVPIKISDTNSYLLGSGTLTSPLHVDKTALGDFPIHAHATFYGQTEPAALILQGTGTTEDPLILETHELLGKVEVYTDGVSIGGSGLQESALECLLGFDETYFENTGRLDNAPVTFKEASIAQKIPIAIKNKLNSFDSEIPFLSGDGTTTSPLTFDPYNLAANVPINADQITIMGEGTIAQPLYAVPLEVDATYFLEDGSPGHPLSFKENALNKKIPIAINSTYFSGDGKTATPLGFKPSALANAIPITASDSFSGNGTSGSPLALNLHIDSTLTGAGTVASPLGSLGANVLARYTTAGANTFTVPAGLGVRTLRIEVLGGGGGGGGSGGDGVLFGAGGGGTSGALTATEIQVYPGATFYAWVGSGGVGGNAGGSSVAGGNGAAGNASLVLAGNASGGSIASAVGGAGGFGGNGSSTLGSRGNGNASVKFGGGLGAVSSGATVSAYAAGLLTGQNSSTYSGGKGAAGMPGWGGTGYVSSSSAILGGGGGGGPGGGNGGGASAGVDASDGSGSGGGGAGYSGPNAYAGGKGGNGCITFLLI